MSVERLERMTGQAPDYYVPGGLFYTIQQAQGDEYDSLEDQQADLQRQLRIGTATWGLRYYEEAFNIPVYLADSYETRRSRVLGKRRSLGNYSAALIRSVAESFSGGEAAVTTYLKNWLPPFSAWTKHANAVIDGTDPYKLTLNATGAGQSTYYTLFILPNTTYYVSAKDNAPKFFVQLLDANNVQIGGNIYAPAAFTTPSNAVKATIYTGYNSGAGTFVFSHPQLELGSVATAFEQRKDNTVGVTFIGKRGIPERLDDLKAALDEIVHAHLATEYYFTYLTWDEIDTAAKTWNAMDALAMTWDAMETWKP